MNIYDVIPKIETWYSLIPPDVKFNVFFQITLFFTFYYFINELSSPIALIRVQKFRRIFFVVFFAIILRQVFFIDNNLIKDLFSAFFHLFLFFLTPLICIMIFRTFLILVIKGKNPINYFKFEFISIKLKFKLIFKTESKTKYENKIKYITLFLVFLLINILSLHYYSQSPYFFRFVINITKLDYTFQSYLGFFLNFFMQFFDIPYLFKTEIFYVASFSNLVLVDKPMYMVLTMGPRLESKFLNLIVINQLHSQETKDLYLLDLKNDLKGFIHKYGIKEINTFLRSRYSYDEIHKYGYENLSNDPDYNKGNVLTYFNRKKFSMGYETYKSRLTSHYCFTLHVSHEYSFNSRYNNNLEFCKDKVDFEDLAKELNFTPYELYIYTLNQLVYDIENNK